MLSISYPFLMALITVVWLIVRAAVCMGTGQLRLRREAQLLLVYICIIVVARFTCFPFGTVDGRVQPLLFDASRMLPPRVNGIPFVYLFDYPTLGEALLNLIGNTAMFLPLGIVWPVVFRELDTPARAIAAGAGFSLAIELLQLPFYDRVSDIDDLILNTAGYLIGYGILLAVRHLRGKKRIR